jgi:hypothetical protein
MILHVKEPGVNPAKATPLRSRSEANSPGSRGRLRFTRRRSFR